MSQILLYIDEDASRGTFVTALRKAGINLLTTSEANNLGFSDPEQLIWATNNNRVIYTFNARDYCRLHKNYLIERKEHAGIIVAGRQSYSVGEQLRGLQRLISSVSAKEIRNQLIFIGAYIRDY